MATPSHVPCSWCLGGVEYYLVVRHRQAIWWTSLISRVLGGWYCLKAQKRHSLLPYKESMSVTLIPRVCVCVRENESVCHTHLSEWQLVVHFSLPDWAVTSGIVWGPRSDHSAIPRVHKVVILEKLITGLSYQVKWCEQGMILCVQGWNDNKIFLTGPLNCLLSSTILFGLHCWGWLPRQQWEWLAHSRQHASTSTPHPPPHILVPL